MAQADQNVGQCQPAGQHQADLPVARQVAGGGEHQVAQARQPHEGFGPGAQCRAQTAHLGQATGDQRGAGVQPQRQAVGDAGGDRHHVLDRATHCNPDRVVAGVDAQAVAVERLHGQLAKGLVGAGGDQCGRLAVGHLEREAGARQHPAAQVGPQLAGNLVAQRAAAGLEAFAQPQRLRAGRQRQQALAQTRHRRADHRQALSGHRVRLSQIGGDAQAGGQGQLGQVTAVAAAGGHLGSLRRIPGPQQHRMAQRGRHRQRSAPGASAQHDDRQRQHAQARAAAP